ncbi:MAG: sigma-70 family RNA polymerase sigma factor [Candidatus Dormibacteraeota bacterium]|nr:sigma-70 family RNA polymerase sigma factor [Candidatus Dormibacteraeota bacterium]
MSLSLQDENAASRYADWLDRARGHDREAFADLYGASYRRVFAYLLARLGEREAAEDLLQEVYVTALHGISRFRGHTEGEFIGWLLKIAGGKVVDCLRARYRHPEVTPGNLPAGHSPDPLDAIDERLRRRELAEALAHLTQEQREVIVNRFVLGFDLEETGRLMRKNVGSIKALQHRGLAQLARILSKEPGDHA